MLLVATTKAEDDRRRQIAKCVGGESSAKGAKQRFPVCGVVGGRAGTPFENTHKTQAREVTDGNGLVCTRVN